MLPTKTLASSVSPKKPKQDESLWDCFMTIVNRQLLHLNAKKLNNILENDLKCNLKALSHQLKCVLAECLCYYMKMWPGWSKFNEHFKTDQVGKELFEKFREYLIYKINYIIENEKSFWNSTNETKNENIESKEVQTYGVHKNSKPEAPYTLVISGQPNVLNNIVFLEANDNIVMKQHAEKSWKALTISEFLNYSFVYSEVKLFDIHVSRSNLHEFQRYITECGTPASCPDVDFITYIRQINSMKRKVYTYNYIHAYCKQVVDILRKISGVSDSKVSEIEEIFNEFLKDIQETNLQQKTMATSTSVCFNIGRNKYIRNKKLVVNSKSKKDANGINFCEILIPRMSFTLHNLITEEDVTSEEPTFKNLNDIASLLKKGNPSDIYPLAETVNNCISYRCVLCPKVFNGDQAYIEILDHFRFLHKGEQSVLCFKCRRQFDIPALAGSRWAHVCEAKTSVIKSIPTAATTKASSSSSAVSSVTSSIETATSTFSSVSISDCTTSNTKSISTLSNRTVPSTDSGKINEASQPELNNLPVSSDNTNLDVVLCDRIDAASAAEVTSSDLSKNLVPQQNNASSNDYPATDQNFLENSGNSGGTNCI